MGILSQVADFFGGSIFKEIKETVLAYLPPGLTPVQKAEIEIRLSEILHEKQSEANRHLAAAAIQLDKRVAEQEGTAKDLKSVPLIGTLVIFLRGCQRPIWGYATIYIDIRWFFYAGQFTDKQESALIIINLLVLGFLFGERAVLNLQPLIEKLFVKK